MSSLPDELWLRILDETTLVEGALFIDEHPIWTNTPNTSRETLDRLAVSRKTSLHIILVCRAWHALGMRFIFRYIQDTYVHPGFRIPSKIASPAFQRGLETLEHAVRRVDLDFRDDESSSENIAGIWRAVERLVARCALLEVLIITGRVFGIPAGLFSSLGPRVRYLSVTSSADQIRILPAEILGRLSSGSGSGEDSAATRTSLRALQIYAAHIPRSKDDRRIYWHSPPGPPLVTAAPIHTLRMELLTSYCYLPLPENVVLSLPSLTELSLEVEWAPHLLSNTPFLASHAPQIRSLHLLSYSVHPPDVPTSRILSIFGNTHTLFFEFPRWTVFLDYFLLDAEGVQSAIPRSVEVVAVRTPRALTTATSFRVILHRMLRVRTEGQKGVRLIAGCGEEKIFEDEVEQRVYWRDRFVGECLRLEGADGELLFLDAT